MQDEKYQQKSKSISSAEPNYFVHFAMRYPVYIYIYPGHAKTGSFDRILLKILLGSMVFLHQKLNLSKMCSFNFNVLKVAQKLVYGLS